jgi:pyruvate/2-oxoglutarate dehydrogenase complex dihydrolipoamide acyltransferase (E2) component
VAPRGSNRRERDDEQTLSDPQQDGLAENQDLRPVGEDADVVLDVPMLNVEELDLEVEDLRAHISARAQLADFVNINVGVDAYLDKVKLEMKGVEAQVLLKVQLERILGTIERALTVIEQNPGLLDAALREANRATGEIEGAVGGAADQSATEVEATDAARRKAEELGVDLTQIEGTGVGGRILVRDVNEAAG